MNEGEGGVKYQCAKCEKSIRVFVKAKVRCSRCGRAMKAIKTETKK